MSIGNGYCQAPQIATALNRSKENDRDAAKGQANYSDLHPRLGSLSDGDEHKAMTAPPRSQWMALQYGHINNPGYDRGNNQQN